MRPRADSGKIKKFRYHEYKYPVEKPRRRDGQAPVKRRPSARRGRMLEEDPSEAQYHKLLQQQQRFLQLQQPQYSGQEYDPSFSLFLTHESMQSICSPQLDIHFSGSPALSHHDHKSPLPEGLHTSLSHPGSYLYD